MIAFDTDIFTELVYKTPAYAARARAVPRADQSIPIIVAEEVLRGRLNLIRQADAKKVRATLEQAYALFNVSLEEIAVIRTLPYTATADALFRTWRAAKMRVGTQDLRIAAICVAHDVTLVTRNARDYGQVPGLILEVWN